MPAQGARGRQHGSHAQTIADLFLLPPSARAGPDHFLQSDYIRLQPFQDSGDACGMGPTVYSPAFVNVVGDDP
jgi:hypothetical protein